MKVDPEIFIKKQRKMARIQALGPVKKTMHIQATNGRRNRVDPWHISSLRLDPREKKCMIRFMMR